MLTTILTQKKRSKGLLSRLRWLRIGLAERPQERERREREREGESRRARARNVETVERLERMAHGSDGSDGCDGTVKEVLTMWRTLYRDARLVDAKAWFSLSRRDVAYDDTEDDHSEDRSHKHRDGSKRRRQKAATDALSIVHGMAFAERRPAALNGMQVRSPLAVPTGTYTAEWSAPCNEHSLVQSVDGDGERVCGHNRHANGPRRWVNLYRACVPDMEGASGRRSTVQIYVKSLEASGLDAACATSLFTGLVWPCDVTSAAPLRVVTHQNVGLDPIEFTRRTLMALEVVERVIARRLLARLGLLPSGRYAIAGGSNADGHEPPPWSGASSSAAAAAAKTDQHRTRTRTDEKGCVRSDAVPSNGSHRHSRRTNRRSHRRHRERAHLSPSRTEAQTKQAPTQAPTHRPDARAMTDVWDLPRAAQSPNALAPGAESDWNHPQTRYDPSAPTATEINEHTGFFPTPYSSSSPNNQPVDMRARRVTFDRKA